MTSKSEVLLKGKRVRYDNSAAIGKGGEADIFDLGNGQVLKVFKTEDHPDLALDPAAQRAAVRRIDEQQAKLPALAAYRAALPNTVILPEALATDRAGKIVGYAMPFMVGAEVLMRFGQRDSRQAVSTDVAVSVLRDLHATVAAMHQARVIIGDFNDLNVLVKDQRAYVIDADSLQFPPFQCLTYTTTFVDPRLCDPRALAPTLVQPHSSDSDWYAFAVMVLQTLLFVGPYGGLFRPKDPTQNVVHTQRPLKRITVFHPEVRYPKPAVPFGALPDDLLQHLYQVFEKDARGVFPLQLLERLRWTKCTACGVEHGRATCPYCATTAPAALKETTVVRGQVTATRVLTTSGRILRAEAHKGKGMWLYYEAGELRREGGVVVGRLELEPHLRYRLRADATYLGKGAAVLELTATAPPRRFAVDVTGSLPAFDANDAHVFWADDGVLYRDGSLGPQRIGDVLRGQTFFWVGPSFGFGFYRAGSLSVAFVFSASAQSLNDGMTLPRFAGQLIDATCTFSDDRAWFFTTSREGANTVNRCTLLRASGEIEASAEAMAGDGTWLGRIHGAVGAGGSHLLVPTDEGVVRIHAEKGSMTEVERFPDTEPFVDASSTLLALSDGLYIVSQTTITRLVIARKGK